jgi:hypothetical protein
VKLGNPIEPHRFTADPQAITERVTEKLNRVNAAVLFLHLCFAGGIFFIAATSDFQPPDYKVFIETTSPDAATAEQAMADFYYAHWLLPVMDVLARLPFYLHYALWGGVAVVGIFVAAHVFGGRVPAVMLTYQMLFVTFYGQFTGIMIGALAVFWWAMAQRRWDVAGCALFVAATKYHIAGPFALMLWLLADISWRDRFRLLAVPVILGAISLIAYPLWPVTVWENMQAHPPKSEGSLALWQWVGPFSLVVWLPALLLPLDRGRRVIAVGSAIALGLPYFQQADLLMLYALPVGWLGLLGNSGFLYIWYTDRVLRAMVFIPAVIYVCAVGPAALAWARRRIAISASRT